MLEFDTPHGRARVHLNAAERPRGAVVLGHGAGGGVDAPDVLAAAAAAAEMGFSVALVEQPYRVAGKRSPAPASQLDRAWLATLEALCEEDLRDLPLVAGGRSAGARVACRTAAEAGARAVLCLAFPAHPPGKGGDPSKSRLAELDALHLPVLVVQGDRDPFGMPPPARRRKVVNLPGDHSLRKTAGVKAAVAEWLAKLKL